MSDTAIIMTAFLINNLVWMIFFFFLFNARRGVGDLPIKFKMPSLPLPERFKRVDPDPEKHEFADLSSNAPSIAEAMKSLRDN